MIGKFSRVKEINHLYCAGILPQINDKSISLQNPERSPNKSTEKSVKKEKALTL